MNEIPKSYGSANSEYYIILLCDIGEYALYMNKSGGYFSGYEVHKIRTRKGRTCEIAGKSVILEACRYLASSEEFGKHAFHYPTLEQVYKAYPMFQAHHNFIEKAA
jgi:hypothetical protein